MKNYFLILTLLFCFSITTEAQFLAPADPVSTCNLEGPNSFEPTHHRTFAFFGYSETHVYGNIVNPCGDVVGSHTQVYTNNWN